jgi:pyruvate,orthophosphate dikinase
MAEKRPPKRAPSHNKKAPPKKRKSRKKKHDGAKSMQHGPKRIWFFGGGTSEGRAQMKEELGGKGANLAEMARLGLPVPPGFTIGTAVCDEYWRGGGTLPKGLWPRVRRNVRRMQRAMGGKFGEGDSPILVSVRSGAAISMPGMMETVLNVGLNDATREALAKKTGNRRMALDSQRRLIQMFARVVLDLDIREFERALESLKSRRGVWDDTDLSESDLEELIDTYREIFQARSGRPFPEDPWEQLRLARWSSATWARPRPPASASPVTPPPAATCSTASF